MIPWGLALAISMLSTALALGAVYVFVHRPLSAKLLEVTTNWHKTSAVARNQHQLLAWVAQVLRIEPNATGDVYKNALKALQRKKTRAA